MPVRATHRTHPDDRRPYDIAGAVPATGRTAFVVPAMLMTLAMAPGARLVHAPVVRVVVIPNATHFVHLDRNGHGRARLLDEVTRFCSEATSA